jgi:hypothetical protein
MVRFVLPIMLVLVLSAAPLQVNAQPTTTTADDCPFVSHMATQWVLQCGTDDPITVTAPYLSTGDYSGATLEQSGYTTSLVWLSGLGGLSHTPVWRYLTADGSAVCQLDGRPSPSGNIARSCLPLDPTNL